ncbi:MAG: nodulation protein [Acidobacteria bacterium]|nr:MAG: nodulation protein [Acidobacteriota bacterium]
MLTLGLAGGLDPVHEARLDSPDNYTYDGAAVLVEDGAVVAAVEESRVDRIRRSNKFPSAAIRTCLEQRGAAPEDLDLIAYYAQEQAANQLLSRLYFAMPDLEWRLDARQLMAATLKRELRAEIDPARLRFFQHKLTHAAGALAHSGFDAALILILDNSGGLFLGRREESGAVGLEEILPMPPGKSTTRLFQSLLPFLGLGPLDDHRAIAMAQSGDPAVFRPLFKNLYELLPDGGYNLRLERIGQLVGKLEPAGKEGPGQQHRDLAATLQEVMEEIVLHVLGHYRQATGQRNLCMAGGIVENSTANGRVLYSGLFDDVFVHPSANDSGCALGAALLASEEAGRPAPRRRLQHVYWGSDAGESARADAVLERWGGFLTRERSPEIVRRTAELLAGGALVGWVQGRSEFCSRSLGNRSVLADPRAVENRARVDAALKRPAGSVPIVPAVLEEKAREFFAPPDGMDSFPYTAFAVRAREDKRPLLGATLLADGTGWLQTVSRETSPRFWELIRAFEDLTGLPALLNTSFSTRAEPTVESVEDAVVAFLTTDLDHLVVGDFVVRKRAPTRESLLALAVSLPPYVRLQRNRSFVAPERMATRCQIRTSYDAGFSRSVSSPLFDLLMSVEGEKRLGELLRERGMEGADEPALIAELNELWSQRLVRLRA